MTGLAKARQEQTPRKPTQRRKQFIAMRIALITNIGVEQDFDWFEVGLRLGKLLIGLKQGCWISGKILGSVVGRWRGEGVWGGE